METLHNYLGGREQAFIKHMLLKSYLEMLFVIVGSHQKRICYIDCFSGPWEESSDDLMDTSIGISIDIMKKSRNALAARGKYVDFRALYIEKDKNSFAKLSAFLKEEECSGIELTPIRGSFIDKREDILRWCGPEDFAFFFIDPKGYTDVSEPATLRPLLHRPNSELLINFMYDHLNRFVGADFMKSRVVDIFGEVPVLEDMEPKDREAYLMSLYRGRLKDVMSEIDGNPWFAYVSVLDPKKDKTKYELVYLTRHALGILKFLDASEPLEIVQRHVKQKSKEHHTGQPSLFDFDQIATKDEGVSIETVKQFWLSELSTIPEPYGYDKMADMHEKTGWFMSDFQRALVELINEGRVENLAMKNKRPKRPLHYEEESGFGERLRKLT